MVAGGCKFWAARVSALCICLTVSWMTGCERHASPTDTGRSDEAAREAESILAPIWTKLTLDDTHSFRQALEELKKVPRSVHEAARYTIEGNAGSLDVMRIGEVRIRADGEWMKRTLRAFVGVVDSSPPVEARQAYEALDNLLAGVMISARDWKARQTVRSYAPQAWGTVVDLRALLARAMLESECVRDDAEFREALEKRRARLIEIGKGYFKGQISSEVP